MGAFDISTSFAPLGVSRIWGSMLTSSRVGIFPCVGWLFFHLSLPKLEAPSPLVWMGVHIAPSLHHVIDDLRVAFGSDLIALSRGFRMVYM